MFDHVLCGTCCLLCLFLDVAVLSMCSQLDHWLIHEWMSTTLQVATGDTYTRLILIKKYNLNAYAALLFNVWWVVYWIVSHGKDFEVQKISEPTDRPFFLLPWRPETGEFFRATFFFNQFFLCTVCRNSVFSHGWWTQQWTTCTRISALSSDHY